MLFEEALPLGSSDPVLSTLNLVQVRPWRKGRPWGAKAMVMLQKEPEPGGQSEELGSSSILLLTSVDLPFWGLLFPA